MTELSKKLIRLAADELRDEKKGAPTIQDVITELICIRAVRRTMRSGRAGYESTRKSVGRVGWRQSRG